MGSGPVCKCSEGKVPLAHFRRWWVLQRNCNHSAFNGYHRTYSDYSQVMCRVCGATWRTKADYVASVDDAPEDWPNAPLLEPRKEKQPCG